MKQTGTTAGELMVSRCSKFIKEGENVFVGVGVPLLACLLAVRTHAPNVTIFFEGGGVGYKSPRIPWTISDNPTTEHALMVTETWRLFSDAQKGFIDCGLLGAAQVDRFGNINTSVLFKGDGFSYQHPKVRLPGSGGGNDIATFCHRFIVTCTLNKGRFVERVDYLTSPGYLRGGDSRVREGIRWGGPEAIVTDRGVFKFDPVTKEVYLAEIYPGNTVEEIRSLIPWDLKVADTVGMAQVSDEEVNLIRALDPLNIFLGDKSVTHVEDFDTFYTLMSTGQGV
ncbi:MAG: CoA-transferase subunit beta [Desulfitobacteriaceae bacterium]